MKEDWISVDIDSVFATLENGKDINQGWSPQCKKNPSPSEDIWGVLKTTAIQKNEFWDYENKELPIEKKVREYLEVKVGDILVTCAGPRNRCGVVCTVNKTRKKLLLSGKMYRFRVNPKIMTTNFLTLFLQTQEAWLSIDKMKTGGSESGLNLTHSRFRKLPIRIAPLPEQRVIATKIDLLFSELDNGIKNLKTAQAQLITFRHAVLKSAFEGNLTIDWRKNNPYSLESFLSKLKYEKQNSIKNKLIQKGDYFPSFKDEDLTYNVPDNWITIPWKTITSNNKYAMKRGPFGSSLKKSFFVEDGNVVYEQYNAINDDPYRHRYFIDDNKYEELKAFSVKPGDMIISCSGGYTWKNMFIASRHKKGCY